MEKHQHSFGDVFIPTTGWMWIQYSFLLLSALVLSLASSYQANCLSEEMKIQNKISSLSSRFLLDVTELSLTSIRHVDRFLVFVQEPPRPAVSARYWFKIFRNFFLSLHDADLYWSERIGSEEEIQKKFVNEPSEYHKSLSVVKFDLWEADEQRTLCFSTCCYC